MTIQSYIRPQTLEEAYQLNQKRNNRIVGGMLWLKMGERKIGTAIDLCDLGLDTIEETDEGFSIGAMVSLRQLELHEGLNNYTNNAVKAAVQDIIGVQFRNMATVGGSIWGRFGFSDVLTVFLAMDTYVELYKGGCVPLKEFVGMKYDNDILVRIHVKKHAGTYAYRTVRIQRTDFPVLACATSKVEGTYLTVIGARPGRAVTVADEEGLLQGEFTEEKADAYAAYVASQVETGSNSRGSAAYRAHLVQVLTKRNIMEIGGRD